MFKSLLLVLNHRYGMGTSVGLGTYPSPQLMCQGGLACLLKSAQSEKCSN